MLACAEARQILGRPAGSPCGSTRVPDAYILGLQSCPMSWRCSSALCVICDGAFRFPVLGADGSRASGGSLSKTKLCRALPSQPPSAIDCVLHAHPVTRGTCRSARRVLTASRPQPRHGESVASAEKPKNTETVGCWALVSSANFGAKLQALKAVGGCETLSLNPIKGVSGCETPNPSGRGPRGCLARVAA